MRTRTALALTALAFSGLLLTACTGAPPAPVATESEPAASPTEDPGFAADDPACLVGEWAMDQERLQDFYDSITALMGPTGMAYTPTGSAGLAFREDGTFSWVPDTVIETRVSGVEMVVALSGTIDGSYTVADGRIVTDNESTEGLVIEATANDQPVDASQIAEQIAFAPVSDAAYTCTADLLTLETAIPLPDGASEDTLTTTLDRQ